jgi:hypothetical protein
LTTIITCKNIGTLRKGEEEKIMKVILFIALAAVITVFVLFSFNWKSKEQTTQVEYTKTSKVQTDIVDRQTDRMMSANAQAGDMVATGVKPVLDASREPSAYIPSGAAPVETEEEPLKISWTYSVKAGDYFGCESPLLLRRLVKYVQAYDDTRFKKLMDKSMAAGTAVYFRRGEAVRVEEINAGAKEVRVSRYGDSKSYWTVFESIR